MIPSPATLTSRLGATRYLKPVLSGAAVLLGITMAFACIETVGVNQIGLKFKKAGSARGLNNLNVVSGYVFINPLMETIVTYPRQQINYTWTAGADGMGDESFTFNTADQVRLNADVNVGIQVIAERAPEIYVRFGPSVAPIVHGYIHSVVRDTITRSASQFTTDQILGSARARFEDTVEKGVQETLSAAGFELRNLGFVGEIRPPKQISEAINLKFQAQQDAIRAENKVAQSKAEAQQRVAKAQGDAQSILLTAKAQAEANLILARSLTPNLIQSKYIERWDGKMPQYVGGQGTSTLMQLPAVTPSQKTP